MNKGNQPSGDSQKPAESVEQRGLAKGNTRRTPTAETQGSGKVSRGLLGVREAARRDKNEIKRELRRRFQDPVPETGRWLRQVLQGYYRYLAVPYNLDALNQFRYEVGRAWLRALRRRSQKARRRLTWEKFKLILGQWLPMPRITHPWPNVRFRRHHPRQEPYAVMPHVRICTGGAS